jgi:ATP-dependent exoDNAse (exonuclease V) beta subunit
VSALKNVLPQLAAELKLAFRDSGELDFVEGTIAAIDALGTELAPSDLLLKLDARIDHLLVDEFQDTSFTQLALLRRLTAGWAEGDGRTVFAVGDPMQSIYRFREAEVRIFVEAQAAGRVAEIPVENLRLERNFRSHAGLVAWVNATFPQVLGRRNDPWRGAVAFAPATATKAAPPVASVTLDVAMTATAEAEQVVGRVRAALDAGPGTVAILVRARVHLDCVLPALRAAGISYAAVELDALAERQAILDLESLTHALAQPADRLAWLAVLRAPWCGLTLADLFAVASAAAAHASMSIAALMDAPEAIVGIGGDGATRLQSAARVLRPALAARGRGSLAARVRGAWLALGAPATLDEAIDVDAAERFFALLASHERAGDVPDWAAFVAALRELYAAPADEATARVQVMTLHRAKGLEFDTVILPGLARRTSGRDAELLRLRIRERGPLVGPSRARGGEADPIYAYLGLLASDEDRAELGRLLYVGSTRARTRLHLSTPLSLVAAANGTPAWERPPRGSALAQLADAIAAMMPPPPAAQIATAPSPPPAPRFVRVTAKWGPAAPGRGVPVGAPAALAEAPLFDWVRETARRIGVVAHRWLARLAFEGLAAWSEARVAAVVPRLRAELAEQGVDARELDEAVKEVASVLANVIADPRGRWLFAPEHTEAHSEWALAGVDANAVAHVAVDRTFVVDGVRWIVDFKTGRHEGADLDAFLDQERERYREQLDRYARIVRALDSRPIRLGLYHPLVRGWREWPSEGAPST